MKVRAVAIGLLGIIHLVLTFIVNRSIRNLYIILFKYVYEYVSLGVYVIFLRSSHGLALLCVGLTCGHHAKESKSRPAAYVTVCTPLLMKLTHVLYVPVFTSGALVFLFYIIY